MYKHPNLRVVFILACFVAYSEAWVTPPALAADGVANEELRLQWSANGDWLWYRREPTRVEPIDGQRITSLIKVNALTGEKQPLYDAARLAEALGEQFEGDIDLHSVAAADVLRLLDDGQGFEFHFRGKNFAADADYSLAVLEAAVDADGILTRGTRSQASSQEMQLSLTNGLAAPCSCWWLSADGNAVEYATLAVGETWSQHTFAGHLWSIRDENGTELIRLSAREDRAEVQLNEALVANFAALPERGGREPRRGRGRAGRPRPSSSPGVVVEQHNVWKIGEDGERHPLTEDGTPDHPYRGPLLVSPSGKFLAAIRERVVEKRQISIIESSPSPGAQPVVRTFDYPKPGDELDQPTIHLFNLESGHAISVAHDLMTNPWSLSLLDWTSERERILCLYNQRGHQRGGVLAIDPSDGSVQAIVDESSPTFIDYAHKTFVELLDANKELLWMSERSGFNHVFRFSTLSGEMLNPVTAAPFRSGLVRDVEQVDRERGQLWFVASGVVPDEDPYCRHLCRVDLDGSNFVRLTDGDGDHRWEFSPDRRFLVDRYSRVDMPTVTNLRNAADGSLVCELERADWSELLESGWSVPERFVAKGRDGQTDIFGVVIRPRDFDPSQSYPVIEKVYAGPQSAYVPKAFSRLRQEHEFADMGAIVVMVDGMGTSHRGKAFHDVCWKNLADAGFPDRIAWIKALAETYPYLDLTRVGTFGGSAGGQNAMRALLDHHDFYKVAVADCGCHDNRMDKIWWNEAWMGWPLDASYEQSSNVVHADRLQGKLLLIVGELDQNVDPASTLQVVDALVKADKDFELLIVPGAGHGAAETRYGSRRRADFLRRHLIDQ